MGVYDFDDLRDMFNIYKDVHGENMTRDNFKGHLIAYEMFEDVPGLTKMIDLVFDVKRGLI